MLKFTSTLNIYANRLFAVTLLTFVLCLSISGCYTDDDYNDTMDDSGGGFGSGISRFVDNGDGTFTDNMFGLIWLKDANCFGALPWEQARFAPLSLAPPACGLSDGSAAGEWYLPNMQHLGSLLDQDTDDGFVPDAPFVNKQLSLYWSATDGSNLGNPAIAWYASFYNPITSDWDLKTYPFYVLAVRNCCQFGICTCCSIDDGCCGCSFQ